MYGELRKAYNIFQNQGVEDPLSEILHLADIISGGALYNVATSLRDLSHLDLAQVAHKRKEGTPMEYILGTATFAGLSLQCTDKTVLPTECTKLLVDVVVDFVKNRQASVKEQTIIEVGTGCGNIAISIAMQTEDVEILATDISSEALGIARENLDTYYLSDKITLVCGDLFSPFHGNGHEGSIDLITCNPPYIPTSSLKKLSREVVEYQPRIALDAGPYGIDFFLRMVNESILMLKPGGVLVFEIGAGQEKLVTRILSRNISYEDIRYFKDKDGVIRVLSATKRPV